MPDEIDIIVRDKINSRIRRKIVNIARASEIAQVRIDSLKKSLNFNGLSLGLRNSGISKFGLDLQRATAESAKLSASVQQSASAIVQSQQKSQQAIARTIDLEKRLQDKRIELAVRADEKLRALAAKTTQDIRTEAAKQLAIRKDINNKTLIAERTTTEAIRTEAARQKQIRKQAANETTAIVIAAAAKQREAERRATQAGNEINKRSEIRTRNLKRRESDKSVQLAQREANKTAEIKKREQQVTLDAARAGSTKLQALAEREGQKVRREEQRTHSVRRKLKRQELEFTRRISNQTIEIAEREAAKTREILNRGRDRTRLDKQRLRDRNTGARNRDNIRTSDFSQSTSERAALRSAERLQVHLNRLSLEEDKLARKGLAAAASQNALAAANSRLSGTTQITARHTTTLNSSEIAAAHSANRLATSNNLAARSQNELRISAAQASLAELRLSKAENGVSVSSNRAATSVDRLTNSHRTQNGVLKRTIGSVRNLLAIYGGYNLLFAVGEGLDTFTQVNNRLVNITETAGELELVKRKLFDIAIDTRVPIEQLATSFQRYDKALSVTGASQQEVLDFTETLTKALKNNGNTAQETASVITQLSQALTSDTLQGEELKSLRENAPKELLEALAKATGASIKELKELGRQGKLTAEVIRQAIANSAEGVRKAFEGLDIPFTDRLIQFGTKFTQFLEGFENRTGVFEFIGDKIFELGDNLHIVEREVTRSVVAFGVFKALKFGAGLVNQLTDLVLSLRGVTGATALATGGLSLLAAGAAIGVGTLVAYRDEIKVTSDEAVTLGDAMIVQWERIKEASSAGSSFVLDQINSLFSLPPENNFLNTYNQLWTDMAFFAGSTFNNLWVDVKTWFNGIIPAMESIWLRFLKFVTQTAQTAFKGLIQPVLSGLANNPNLNKALELWTGLTSVDIGKFALDVDKGFNNRLKGIESEFSNHQKNLSEIERKAAAEKKKFNDNLQLSLDLNAVAFETRVRKRGEERVRIAKKTADEIGVAEEKLNKSRKAALTPAATNAAGTLTLEEQGNLLESLRATQAERVRISEISNVRLRSIEQATSDVFQKNKDLQIAIMKRIGEQTGKSGEEVRNMLKNDWIEPLSEAIKAEQEATNKVKSNTAERISNRRSETNVLRLQTNANHEYLTSFNRTGSEIESHIEGISSGFQSNIESGREYFNSLSEGYTNLISKASEFRQSAQESLQGAAEGLGNGLAGDKAGFGEFFKGLFNSFIDSRNADFSSRLAAAGPGRASQQVGSNIEDQKLQQVSQSAQVASQSVNALSGQVAGLSQELARMPTGRFENFVPASVTTQLSSVSSQVGSIGSKLNSIPATGLAEPFTQGVSAATSFATSAKSSISQVSTSADSVKTSINSIGTASTSSTQAITSFSNSAVSSLSEVTSAANAARDAIARIGGGGGGGGIFGLGGASGPALDGIDGLSGGIDFGGFRATGGPVDRSKGYIVGENGPEWFQPQRNGRIYNSQQLRNRIPDAVIPNNSSGETNITINNNSTATVQARQMSDGEIIVMIDEAANRAVETISTQVNNPNSDFSRSISSNYSLRRLNL